MRTQPYPCRLLPLLAASLLPAASHGALVIAGSLQDELGNPADWDPPNSTLIMTDAGGGLHTYTVAGGALTTGTFYEFKVLDDGGTPPANWGDPEVVNQNTMIYGSPNAIPITVDTTQTNGSGGAVVWVGSDSIPLQVVGDFMDEAGGAGDWNPSDPTFAMTNGGGGYYSFTTNISTPGSYQFKATDGTGWNYQVGPDGFTNNAGTAAFTTTAPGEEVTFFIDTVRGQIGVVPESSIALLGAFGGLALLRRRR